MFIGREQELNSLSKLYNSNYIETSNRLPAGVREFIDNAEDISISQATLWEIAIKQTTEKLDLNMTAFELDEKCAENHIAIVPLKAAHFERIKHLPLIHRDPFDRIIMAAAIEEGMTLLTKDREIVKYEEVKTLWQITKED